MTETAQLADNRIENERAADGSPIVHVYAKPLESQEAFLMSEKYEVMIYGGRGGGKTRALCWKAFVHAAIPGNLVLLCRKFGADIKATTLRTLLKPSGDLPPVIPPQACVHYVGDRRISIHNGGDILYFGFDQEDRLGSLEPGCIAIDEACQIDEDEYLMLMGGLRNAADPNPQMLLATNPSTKSHFLYQHFQPENETARHPERDCFHAPTSENETLRPAYIEFLKGMRPQYRKRFFEGKWGNFEGMIWSNFDRSIHVVERDPEEFKRVFAGVDAGFTNPYFFGLFGEDEHGAFHLIDEIHRANLLQHEAVGKSLELVERYRRTLDAVYIDPSAAGLIAAFREADIPVMRANNDVLDGIAKVQSRLDTNSKLGTPLLTISPKCVKALAEIEGYVWKKNEARDVPVKKADHSCDGIRYAIASIDKLPVKFYFVDGKPNERDPWAMFTDPNWESTRQREGNWCRRENEAIWTVA